MKTVIAYSALFLSAAVLVGCTHQQTATTAPDAESPATPTASTQQNSQQPEGAEESTVVLANIYQSETFNYSINYPQHWFVRDTSGVYDHPQEGGVGILLGPEDAQEDFFVSVITSQLSTEYHINRIKDTLTPNQSFGNETTVLFGGKETTLVAIINSVNVCTVYHYITPHGGSWTTVTTTSLCPTYSSERQTTMDAVVGSMQFN